MIALAALLAMAGCADAAPSHARRRAPRTSARVSTHAASRVVIGVGDVPGCVDGSAAHLGLLGLYHSHLLRLVISPAHGAQGQALGCIEAALATGIRVHVAINYSNRWSIPRDVTYFRRVLGYYGPYVWAVSVGSEQELRQGGATESPARFAAVWRAVQPVLARLAPHAVRVAGEVSPWGFAYLRAAYAHGLPGAQALAVHAYATKLGFHLSQVLTWERRTRLPLWVTEGLAGPHAWPGKPHRERPVPLSQLRGAVVADAWLG